MLRLCPAMTKWKERSFFHVVAPHRYSYQAFGRQMVGAQQVCLTCKLVQFRPRSQLFERTMLSLSCELTVFGLAGCEHFGSSSDTLHDPRYVCVGRSKSLQCHPQQSRTTVYYSAMYYFLNNHVLLSEQSRTAF